MIRCCKGCTDRCAEPSCHETCELYLQERARLDEVNKTKRLDSEYHACAKKLSMERKSKWMKKK